MATYDLRPLSVGEILDRGIGLYRDHFVTLVGIAAVCQGPATVVNLYVALGGGVLEHGGLWFLASVLNFLGYLLAAGATLHVISDAYLGHQPDLGTALRFAGRKMWPLFVAGASSGIVIFLAALLLFVPGVIVACGYSVVSPVVVLETLDRSSDALKRSWALTKGAKGKAFTLFVVAFVLVFLPGMAVNFVLLMALRSTPEVGQTLAQVLYLVVRPIVACMFTLFYYDLRVRKEGFDLELLAQQIGVGAATV